MTTVKFLSAEAYREYLAGEHEFPVIDDDAFGYLPRAVGRSRLVDGEVVVDADSVNTHELVRWLLSAVVVVRREDLDVIMKQRSEDRGVLEAAISVGDYARAVEASRR